MTAGDLIRTAIANGATELGLAKEMAGSDDDANSEVRRLRYMIRRAAKGREPNEENSQQVASFFGQEVSRPVRRVVHHPELEAEVLRLAGEAQTLIGQVERLEGQVERLTGRVELLEHRLPPESAEEENRRR